MTRVEQEIDRFRQGVEFNGSIDLYLVNGRPDDEALSLLEKALRRKDEALREQVAHAVVAIGRETDPLHSRGGNLIRNRRIISTLVAYGLAYRGAARDYCLEALQWSVPVDLLREYGGALVENLRQYPDATTLLVVAKAKLMNAEPVVDSLAKSEEWANEEQTLIARAALGDTTLERNLIDKFVTVKDASQKAALAKTTGFIGTRAALQALAREMRTDLVVEMPRVYRRSVRVDIMAALSYNFPDKEFLFDNAVLDDDGYARVEKFCEEEFGIVWSQPRPPFLTIQGFPSGE